MIIIHSLHKGFAMKAVDIEIDLVRAFIAVAETRNFTQAAMRLHRTQSATSIRIKKLEEQVGCKLFNRNTVSVTLTDLGERFLNVAYRLIEVNEEAFITLNPDVAAGKVVLATSETYAACLLPPVLQLISEIFPNVEIELRCGHSWQMLNDLNTCNEVDLVIATKYPRRTDGIQLIRERLLWVAGGASQVHLNTSLPLAMFPNGCIYRQEAIVALNNVNRSWRMAYTCLNYEGVLAAVGSGCAVSVLIESAVPAHFHVLDEVNGFPALAPVDIVLYRNPSSSGILVKHIGETIRKHFALWAINSRYNKPQREIC